MDTYAYMEDDLDLQTKHFCIHNNLRIVKFKDLTSINEISGLIEMQHLLTLPVFYFLNDMGKFHPDQVLEFARKEVKAFIAYEKRKTSKEIGHFLRVEKTKASS